MAAKPGGRAFARICERRGRDDDGPDRRKGGAMAFEHRYDRNNQALLDRESQALSEYKVAVIGCGRLGGSVEEMTLR